MPKTRRNRKVGGKRRKSMKGGNIQDVLHSAQASAQGVLEHAKFDENKKELDEHVKAMQDESRRLAQSGKETFTRGMSSTQQALSSGMSSMQSKGSEALSSGMSLFKKGSAAASSAIKTGAGY